MQKHDPKPIIEILKDKHGVAQVAAQNVVDTNNPAWRALREIAKLREESEESYLVFWLSRLTGKMGIVLNQRVSSQVTPTPGATPIDVSPPRQFTSKAKAEAWCRVHANPETVRHLVVKAVADTLYPKTYVAERPITFPEVAAWLSSMDFRSFPEIEAWSDGITTIPVAQLQELKTWGEMVALLDLE